MPLILNTGANLAGHEIQNALGQNLSSAPSSPAKGQFYFDTTLNKLGVYNGTGWDYMGTSTATGDFSTNTSTSVDGEVVLFNGTTGKSGKRATGSGIAKLTSGVLGTATAGTDYVAATSGSSVQKANGSGGLTVATAGTDYTSPTGSENLSNKLIIVSGAGASSFVDGADNTKRAQFSASGISTATTRTYTLPDVTGTVALTSSSITGTASNVTGTVVVANGGTGATSLTGLVKGNGTAAMTAAVAGTDYVGPTSGSAVQKANGSGGLTAATAGTDYSAGTSALATGIVKSTTTTGALSIAVAGDFPTLNQNTTGTAANVTGTVAIGNGGTGTTSLPTGLLKGAGTGAITAGVAGTDYSTPSSSDTFTNKTINATATGMSISNLAPSNFAAANLTSALTTSATATQFATADVVKTYVDNSVQGLSWKTATRAIAVGNITLSGTQTIDGVAVVAGDRVIAAGQTTASANGIYVVAAGAWARAVDMSTNTEVVNATAYVSEGTTYADTVWTVTTNAPVTLGTSSIAWAQVNGGTVPTATTSTAGKVTLATNAQALAQSDSSAAVVSSALVGYVRKMSATIGAASSVTVTHNWNSTDVTASLWNTSTGAQEYADITQTANAVTATFSAAQTAGAYKLVVTG